MSEPVGSRALQPPRVPRETILAAIERTGAANVEAVRTLTDAVATLDQHGVETGKAMVDSIVALALRIGELVTAVNAHDENERGRNEVVGTLLAKILDLLEPDEDPPPPPLVDQLLPPGRHLLGAYTGTRAEDERFAALVGHPPAIASTYHALDTPQTILPNHAWRVAAGIVPLVSLQTRRANGVPILCSDVAAGLWDTSLLTNAEQIAELGPCLVAFGQEPKVWMRDHPSTDTPADWAAAYRHWAGIMRTHAPQAVLVYWMASAHDTIDYWPGDEWVDVVSVDPYMWAHHPEDRTALQTWAGECAEIERRWPGVPYFLSETGSDTERSDEIAAAWWASVPAALETLPNLRAVVFFNSRQWVVSVRTPLTLAAYKGVAGVLAVEQ